jgi:hypothetical protein
LEEGAIYEFHGILPQLGDVVWDNVLQIGDYVEKWRCLLWNKAYTPLLQGSTSHTKSTILLKNHEGELAVKRVIYRYFSTLDYCETIKFISIGDIKLNLFFYLCRYLTRELQSRKAISLQALPSFLNSWADKSSDQCIFSALQLMFWTHDLLVHCPWFIECPTNFYPAEEETLRLSIEPSQPMEEEPHEEQQRVGRGGKRKRKAHATPTPCVPPKVVVPSPPSAPSVTMPQNNNNNVDLHLDDIALTLSPPQVVIASTLSNSVFQSQHMVVESPHASNIHKVSMFVKNESISNMLENGAIDNPMLMSAFDFVKKVSEFEQHYLSLYVFAILCA